MPIPGLVALGASLIPSVFKGILGIKQKKQAKNLKKSTFTPKSLNEAIQNQRNLTSQRMPGQGVAERNIRASTAGTIRNASGGSVSDKLAVASAADKQEKDALTDLGAQSAQFATQAQQGVNQLLGQRANVEMANEQQFRQTKQRFLDSANQNIFGALSDASSVANTALGGGFSGGVSNKNWGQITSMNSQQIQSALDEGLINVGQLTPKQRLELAKKLGQPIS